MKKLKVIQFGINHEHANGKYITLGLMKDVFDLVGVVDDTYLNSPSMPINRDLYKDAHFITPEEAFNYPDLDAVFIEVPNLKLVEIGMEFAKRGIPMHLDKPAGESLEAYAGLLDLCRKNHVPLQMGYMYRGNPALSFMRDVIRNGTLGTVFEVQMDMNHNYGGEYYQEYMGTFKGGIMFNLGCHLIDHVISTFGAPDHVTPFLKSTPGVNPAWKNNCLAVLEYPYATVMLRACSKVAGNTSVRRWNYMGENGHLCVTPPERFDNRSVVVEMVLDKPANGYPAGRSVFEFPPQKDRYIEQLKEFASIVRGEMENPYTYEHDLLVHKVTLAAGNYFKYEK